MILSFVRLLQHHPLAKSGTRMIATKRKGHGSSLVADDAVIPATTIVEDTMASTLSSDRTNNRTARDRLLFSTTNSNSSSSSNLDMILSASTSQADTLTTTSSGLPLPIHSAADQGRPIISFNTHKFQNTLETESGFPTGLAEVIMRATATLLSLNQERVERIVTSKQDLENEAYLFSAALSELKTSSSLQTYNDMLTLRSLTSSLNRESDSLTIKLREEMSGLKTEIQLEMNARKEESGGDLKDLDMKMMELNNKFTILLGEVRTEIEATKWISTRRVMGAIVVVVVSVIGFVSAPAGAFSSSESTPSGYENEESAVSRFDDPPSTSSTYTPDSASNARPTFLRSLEDLGISRGAEEAEIPATGHYRV